MAFVDTYNNGLSADEPVLATITSIFLRIRSGHDYGAGHGDFKLSERAEARAAAKALTRPLIYKPGEVSSWVSYSIEERAVIRYIDREAWGQTISTGCERMIGKDRVELTEAERQERLAEPEVAEQLRRGSHR